MPDINSRRESFIASLPKVELHVHLEGSAQPETLRELGRTKPSRAGAIEKWLGQRSSQAFHYGDFGAFIEAFKDVALLLEEPADYALLVRRLAERLAAENVRYAEVTLSAGVVLWKKQPLEAVFEAVEEAAAEAAGRLGVRLAWIFDAVRQFGPEHARRVLREAARYRERGVVAFSIGGDEARGPAELFGEIYRQARDLGLHTTAHAGETTGPESVRQAVELLGAERIGHGLSAARDPEVMALLRRRGVPLEVCLSSNVATGVLARAEDHPLRRLLDAGVPVTLNSDDPGMFATSLNGEFELAAECFGLPDETLVEFCSTAVRAAFLEASEKQALLEELQDVAAQPGGAARFRTAPGGKGCEP
jgi:aminodeoxyfutalosine deaminase